MKRTTALLLAAVFAGLGVYSYFAEDFCPVHSPPAAGCTLSHTHHILPAVCLCFWGTFFAPRTFDFCCFQGAGRLPEPPYDRSPLAAFRADIAHPPKALSS